MMKVGLICSHGGHLTEMLGMMEAFAGHEHFFVTYRGTRADELRREHPTYALDNIGTSMWRMARTLPAAWRILRRERPQVLVSTGSEIAIPFFVLAKVLRIRTVFVESVCRVHSTSGTGRLLYPLADSFLVQWPQMLELYGPKARYAGGLL
jgi:beta-1,4-N-acetylglucosaminyltransferase